MTQSQILKISKSGLWTSNQALVAILGLCPLLAVSTNFANSLGMGVATLFIVVLSNFLISLSSPLINPAIRIALFVLIIAGAVSLLEILMQAHFFMLYKTLGIYIPLIITNCIILARAESFASKNNLFDSILDGFFMGLGFLVVIVLIGGIREIIGQGTLFDGLNLSLGLTQDITIHFFEEQYSILFFILPPGAFLILGLLVALKNKISSKIN